VARTTGAVAPLRSSVNSIGTDFCRALANVRVSTGGRVGTLRDRRQ
jgi:hypothetical protein